MKRKNLESNLDLVENIFKVKIKRYQAEGKMSRVICYRNALEMLQLAREGNTENLELIFLENN